jgi:hypothetical protein
MWGSHFLLFYLPVHFSLLSPLICQKKKKKKNKGKWSEIF